MNTLNSIPEYYRGCGNKIDNFSSSILSILNPVYSNNCWENPSK